jgi:hypothetical protein
MVDGAVGVAPASASTSVRATALVTATAAVAVFVTCALIVGAGEGLVSVAACGVTAANAPPAGDTWLSYNDPTWLAKRYGLAHEAEAQVNAMTSVLAAVTKAAATSP